MKKIMRIPTTLFTASLIMALSTSCSKNFTDETIQSFSSGIQSTVYLTTQTEITTIINTTTEKQLGESLCETTVNSKINNPETENELSFALYDEKIGDFVNKFVTDYTDTLSGNDNQAQSINKNELEVFDLSTEGALITQFRDHNQVLLRVKADIYGERGQSHYDIFILDDSYYVSLLTEYYSCYEFSLVDGDIIDRELSKYIVIDGVTYLMDYSNEILIETDQEILESFMDYLQD